MALEEIKCTSCGSHEVTEFRPGRYVCNACETIFEYIDPTHTEVEVAPQFCEEGCGNPIKYKCTLCGKMVCEEHGEKAKVLLAKWSKRGGQQLGTTSVPNLQQAWCLDCFNNMSEEEKVRHITLILKDSDSFPKWVAIETLGYLRHHSAVPALCEALKDEDVASAAAAALGNIGDPSAVSYLCELCGASKDSIRDTRRTAAAALGKIGDSSAVPYLGEAIKDSDAMTRSSAVNALGSIGDPSAVPYLTEALKEADSNVQRYAAIALGNIGDPSAVPYLTEALKDGPIGNNVVVEALYNIGDPQGLEAAMKARKRWKKGKPYRG